MTTRRSPSPWWWSTAAAARCWPSLAAEILAYYFTTPDSQSDVVTENTLMPYTRSRVHPLCALKMFPISV